MGLFSKSGNSSNAEKPLESYKVIYKGGLPDYPKAKPGAIELRIFADRFEFWPTMGSKWLKPFAIRYGAVNDLKIVERQVGFAESMLAGLDSRQLNQANNINITCMLQGKKVIMRFEMLTGISVMGQAKKCRELEDRLLTNGIRDKFAATSAGPVQKSGDVVERLKELNTLRQQGVISEAEFNKAKQQLLA